MNRRSFFGLAAGAAVLPQATASALGTSMADPRETVDAGSFGIAADSGADQSRALQLALDASAREDKPVFLPPGRYVVSELDLPANTRLVGVPGASRLVFGGGAYMIRCTGAAFAQLADLVIDGADQQLDEIAAGLVHISNVAELAITGCAIVRSGRSGLALDRCGGRIDGNRIEGARFAGMRLVESTGMSISDNAVTDCGNGGILVYRWDAGEDGTIVSGNRVERIAAEMGGTGQYGNGINVFRAHSVIVANNRVADCAFSAVRANSADNVQILGNNCSRLGEKAIYSEFAFEGAVIANNVVDGAATGISITNFDEGGRMAVVSGNLLRNLTQGTPQDPMAPATGIGVEADATITGNVIDGADHFGLRLGWGPYLRDVAATGNVIRGAPIGIAVSVVEGSGSTVVTDNLISGASRGGVVGMRWRELSSGDLTRPDAEHFPHLMVDRNRVS